MWTINHNYWEPYQHEESQGQIVQGVVGRQRQHWCQASSTQWGWSDSAWGGSRGRPILLADVTCDPDSFKLQLKDEDGGPVNTIFQPGGVLARYWHHIFLLRWVKNLRSPAKRVELRIGRTEERSAGHTENRFKIKRPNWHRPMRWSQAHSWGGWWARPCQTCEVNPCPKIRCLVSKGMPKSTDAHCWEERARWQLVEHLQEQLGGKNLVYVQLQVHLSPPGTDLDLVQIARPPILNIKLSDLHHCEAHSMGFSMGCMVLELCCLCQKKTNVALVPHFDLDFYLFILTLFLNCAVAGKRKQMMRWCRNYILTKGRHLSASQLNKHVII